MARTVGALIAAQGRRRRQYSQDSLRNALRELSKGGSGSSIRQVAKKFGIPRTTLKDKLEGNHPKTLGRPTALQEADEKTLTEGLVLCGDWGMPMTPADICDLVQSFLARTKENIREFKNNRPGPDWVKSFLRRNPILSKRLSENIKRKRAEVSPETVNSFFDNLSAEEYDKIPECNKINYDETNFTDDPGSKIVIVRRGSRHPENVLDSSKTATSVMFAVTGDGSMLPPYVVFKAKNLYDTWTEGGPPNTRYNRSDSGWFDMKLFEDWFFTVCLPYYKKLPGKKAMIGDNLASHLSIDVIKACTENDIKFILLPPNSTHLTQPLDVSFFRPLKVAWRKELDEYKKKNRGVLPKSEFPRRLANTLVRIEATSSPNIKAGFKACGLVPLDRSAVLKRLQNCQQHSNESTWSEVLVENLKANRFPEKATQKKKTKISVEPGKSIQYEQEEPPEEQSVREEEEKVDDVQPVLETNKKRKKTQLKNTNQKQSKTVQDEDKENQYPVQNNLTVCDKDYVLVNVSNNKCYVGQVVDISNSAYEITFMRKKLGRGGLYFVYPTVPDVLNVAQDSILRKLNLKECKRGNYTFESLDNDSNLY